MVTEDQYEDEEEQVSKASVGKTTRRSTRGSK